MSALDALRSTEVEVEADGDLIVLTHRARRRIVLVVAYLFAAGFTGWILVRDFDRLGAFGQLYFAGATAGWLWLLHRSFHRWRGVRTVIDPTERVLRIDGAVLPYKHFDGIAFDDVIDLFIHDDVVAVYSADTATWVTSRLPIDQAQIVQRSLCSLLGIDYRKAPDREAAAQNGMHADDEGQTVLTRLEPMTAVKATFRTVLVALGAFAVTQTLWVALVFAPVVLRALPGWQRSSIQLDQATNQLTIRRSRWPWGRVTTTAIEAGEVTDVVLNDDGWWARTVRVDLDTTSYGLVTASSGLHTAVADALVGRLISDYELIATQSGKMGPCNR